jgi:eukaryotic-like serine/threonine-protein kinase
VSGIAPSRAAGEMFDNGRYELIAPLGSGNFGEVWKARDTHRGHIVALKILKSADEDAAWHEATRLTELTSPHILPVNNAALAIDVPYIDTELATGGTADDLLTPFGVTPREAIRVVRGVLAGLELCHQRRLVHRDVKPANVFLKGNGDARLGDFGVAAFMDPLGGTPAHGDLDIRPPEVLKGGQCTARSDIYSTGLTLWALLTGRLPFRFDPGKGFSPHKAAVLAGVPEIRNVTPHVSRSLAKVVRRATAPTVAERYATAAEFDNALAGLPDVAADFRRVAPHPRHRDCWEARRRSDGHMFDVCVIEDTSRGFEVSARHTLSGNRMTEHCGTPRTEQALLVKLRKVFEGLR